MKQTTPVPKERDIERKWYVVDAQDKILGRLASTIAVRLMGKDKPIWSPHVDTGDFVVVINAEKIRVTGKKLAEKMYYRHSGYPGGLRKETLSSLMQKSPETVIRHAVKGMLPHNKLGARILKKLKVYRGTEHPHQAQQPVPVE